MIWVFVGVGVLIIGLTVALASGRLGAMPEAVVDRPVPRLPDGELSATDVRDASFAVVIRGYSMEQVDAVLSRLADQLDVEPAEDNVFDKPDDSFRKPDVATDSHSEPEDDLPRALTDVPAPVAATNSVGEDAETSSP